MQKVSNPPADRKSETIVPWSPAIEWPAEWGNEPTPEESAALEAVESLCTACEKLHPVLIRILNGQGNLADIVDAITGVEAAIMAAGGSY